MTKVILNRFYQTKLGTLGCLYILDIQHTPIYTLENPWIDNKPRISCIPEDVYECEPFNGIKYKAVYEVLNVQGRTYILFHSGNTVDHTMGCILLGSSCQMFENEYFIGNSKKTIEYFKSLIGDNKFQLEIKSSYESNI